MRQHDCVPIGAQHDRAIISATSLTRTYTFHQQGAGLIAALRGVVRRTTETRLAVDAIDLTIRPGEVVGLLGPNGAGKTTTLKMLTGLLHPTGGDVTVLGHTPWRREVAYLRRIALVMGQKSMLWWDIPAMDSLLLHKDMYDLSDAAFRESVDELAEMLDVGHLLGVQVRKLSLGERMKLELMAALLHRPEVVFLDEPTIGLDVVAKARVRGFLQEVNRVRGTTILITSHDMDDIEALCSRVMVIDHGRIQYDGSLPDLVRSVQPRKLVTVTWADPIADPAALDAVGVRPDRRRVEDDGRVLKLEVARDDLAAVLATLPRLGTMLDLAVADAAVEEIVRAVFTQGVAS